MYVVCIYMYRATALLTYVLFQQCLTSIYVHCSHVPPEPEVPYYVTVVAVNSVGGGDARSAIAFTKEGSK